MTRARAHLSANAGSLGLHSGLDDLRVAGRRQSLTGDHVRFEQTVHGVRVFGAQVSVSLPNDSRAGPIVHNRYVGNAPAAAQVSHNPVAALVAAASAIGVEPTAAHEAAATELVYFPAADKTLRPAWKLTLRTAVPRGTWLVLIDAASGALLYKENLLRFDSGQIFDPNPAQTNGGSPPAPNCDSPGNASAMAGEYVTKSLLGITASQDQLKGQWVDLTAPGIFFAYKPAGVANEVSRNYIYPCNDDRFEEVMVYHHIDRTQRHIQSLGFSGTSGVLNRPIPAHAHYMAECNAFFDPVNRGIHFGDFDFCPPFSPGYDSGEDADVIVHEYGHAIHDDQVPGWGGGPYPQASQAASMGEGFGDFLAGVMNADPCIGEYINFGDNACGGAPGLRWLQNSSVYPGGYNACPDVDFNGDTVPDLEEPHCGGLVWGGALWDLVEAIGGGSATQQARDIALTLVLEAQFYMDQTPSFNDAAAAVCFADSLLYDSANNGAIGAAFGGRGISSGACAASDFPSIYVRILHEFSGDLDINLKVGANVALPVCTRNVADPTGAIPYPDFYVGYDFVDPCSGFLPPTPGQPWRLEVQDIGPADVGTIQNFEVLLVGGTRCVATGLPIAIPDAGAPVYATVDCSSKVSAVSPTPTPLPAGSGAWGNVDCDSGLSSVDALKVLRFGAGLSVSQTEPCTDIGLPHPVVLTHDQGDIDCNDTVNSVDALKILRFAAGLSVAQTQPCPVIGVDP